MIVVDQQDCGKVAICAYAEHSSSLRLRNQLAANIWIVNLECEHSSGR